MLSTHSSQEIDLIICPGYVLFCFESPVGGQREKTGYTVEYFQPYDS